MAHGPTTSLLAKPDTVFAEQSPQDLRCQAAGAFACTTRAQSEGTTKARYRRCLVASVLASLISRPTNSAPHHFLDSLLEQTPLEMHGHVIWVNYKDLHRFAATQRSPSIACDIVLGLLHQNRIPINIDNRFVYLATFTVSVIGSN